MKRSALLLIAIVVGCSKSEELNSGDFDYIRTSVDLIRTRTALPPGTDSIVMQHSIDSVLRRHRTTPSEYKQRTNALAADAPRAQHIFEAIRDSLKRPR